MSETITRQRAAGTTTGRLGDETPDWSIPAIEADIHFVLVEPLGSTEDNSNRNAVDTTMRLYLPTGSDLRSNDRAVVRGDVFEVVGKVADWRPIAPGGPGGVVAELREVAG